MILLQNYIEFGILNLLGIFIYKYIFQSSCLHSYVVPFYSSVVTTNFTSVDAGITKTLFGNQTHKCNSFTRTKSICKPDVNPHGSRPEMGDMSTGDALREYIWNVPCTMMHEDKCHAQNHKLIPLVNKIQSWRCAFE